MERNYPREDNKKLWEIIENRLRSRQILVSNEVVVELKNKVHNLRPWIEQFKRSIIASDQIQQNYLVLVRKFKRLIDPDTTQHSADFFIIALAQKYSATVVSQENLRPNTRCIPYICQQEHIPYLNLVKFLVAEGSFKIP
jgi:hypothetical protein